MSSASLPDDSEIVERLQGSLFGKWNPASRCKVHSNIFSGFTRQVYYMSYRGGGLITHNAAANIDIDSSYTLRILYLCGLNLTEVPQEVFKFRNLEYLYLDKNRLSMLPPEIGRLTSLTILSLRGNPLTTLPVELANLSQLDSLALDQKQMQVPPPDVVKQGAQAVRAYLRHLQRTAVAQPTPQSAPANMESLQPKPPLQQPPVQQRIDAPIFISYSRKDQSFVERLQGSLREQGLTTWIDNTNLTPGTADWEQAIRQAIASCHAVILVASPSSRESPYVKDELALANANGKGVFPVWAAGTSWMECIPLGWGHTQFVDARGNEYDSGVNKLVAALYQVRR